MVRDQSSWGDDADPFCCDQLQSGPRDITATPANDPEGDNHDGFKSETGEGEDFSRASAPALTSSENHCDKLLEARGGSSTPVISERDRPKAPTHARVSGDNPNGNRTACLPPGGATNRENNRTIGGENGKRGLPPRKADAIAVEFSTHLHGVDKYPLELARLCRFAEFLTENSLMREAYEVRTGVGGCLDGLGGQGLLIIFQ